MDFWFFLKDKYAQELHRRYITSITSVKRGIAVAFAISVDCEIHDIKVEPFSREFEPERLQREAHLVAGCEDPS